MKLWIRIVQAWPALLVALLVGFAPRPAAAADADEGDDDAPAAPAAAPAGDRLDGATPAERAAAMVRYCARIKPSNERYPKASMPCYVARLLLGVDTNYALAKLDAAAGASLEGARRKLQANPKDDNAADPFDKQSMMHTWLLAQDRIPAATTRKIRDFMALSAHHEWRGYGAMNYRLMKDGAGFLAAEQWPDLVDADGLDAAAIRAATRGRLLGYFDEIARRNFHEYGSPIYLAVDLSCVRMLADFARDEEVRRRATLTLDAMLVDLACSWNQGYNVTAAGRAKYWGSSATSPDSPSSTAAVGWMLFGGRRSVSGAGSGWIHSFWLATPGRYQSPPMLAAIAQDRARPSLYIGTVASMAKHELRRTIYHSPSYSLASQWEVAPNATSGLYKETRRTLLKWVSDRAVSTFAVLQDNPQRPYRLQDGRRNAFGYGENPFAQVLQDQGTLIGVYAVPSDYPHYKLYAPFPQSGAIVKRSERDGWVFCHGGSMLFAFRPVKSYTWGKPQEKCDVLWSDHRRNGWMLETWERTHFAAADPAAELARFEQAILTRTRLDATGIDSDLPRLVYRSLAGHTLDLTYRPHGKPYAGQHKIDGKPVEYARFPLHASPWVRQEVDGTILTLRHGGRVRTYDFAKWTVSETAEAGRAP